MLITEKNWQTKLPSLTIDFIVGKNPLPVKQSHKVYILLQGFKHLGTKSTWSYVNAQLFQLPDLMIFYTCSNMLLFFESQGSGLVDLLSALMICDDKKAYTQLLPLKLFLFKRNNGEKASDSNEKNHTREQMLIFRPNVVPGSLNLAYCHPSSITVFVKAL